MAQTKEGIRAEAVNNIKLIGVPGLDGYLVLTVGEAESLMDSIDIALKSRQGVR
jgi:hypothetical protein